MEWGQTHNNFNNAHQHNWPLQQEHLVQLLSRAESLQEFYYYLPAIDLLQNGALVRQFVDCWPSLVLRFNVRVTDEMVVSRLPAWPDG